jgi:mono/diheme cytochrome c family protein
MVMRSLAWCAGIAAVVVAGSRLAALQQGLPDPPERAIVSQYCEGCHNDRSKAGGLSLTAVSIATPHTNPQIWEAVVRKLRTRAMPPATARRPDERVYDQLISYLETDLDRWAQAHPTPGRTDTFRRLTRIEYQNAIRDLLALDVDVTELLPKDDASYGFDNVGAVALSPTLLERYLGAAQKIAALAIGAPLPAAGSRVVELPVDLTQENHLDGLPFGTRGGTVLTHTFPRDGVYEFEVRLMRNRNENVEGLSEPNEIEVTLDSRRLQLFTVAPNRNRLDDYYADEAVDKHLHVRTRVTAGPHTIGAAFLEKHAALIETERQPYVAHFNMNRHPRLQPAVHSVSITGPFESTAVGATPSRDRIFVCRPASTANEPACAKRIVTALARRAYRRPVTDADVTAPLQFYAKARASSSFESAIEMALRALVASPEFLFRVERDPERVAPGSAYRISDVELASRLSFFLWSSIPDDALLAEAERGRLHEPAVLAQQVRRMLADRRSGSLTTNFASQWLYLRNLAAAEPNLRLFPDFDDNLRQGFRRETELFFQSIVAENRSVLDLLDADYTFVNERVARHYGIPHVYGDRFRRVALPADSVRRGLLGQGSILTVTSHSTRTSPVRRGKWILDNIFGMPPSPPPDNIPPLKENAPGQPTQTMRQLMAEHRSNPTCAACHAPMDPLGLALENFDAIGRWRTVGEGRLPIDASGSLPGGATFDGVTGLRTALLSRPDLFVDTLTGKLLTYALGRGVDYRDAAAIREIRGRTAADSYRFSSLVAAIASSTPFQMRTAGEGSSQ